jgi:hypothetical protein
MDVRELRLLRLQQLLIEEEGRGARGAKARLGHRVGKASAQISMWLNGRRTIEEQSAREMENYARLAPRWFDEPSPHEPAFTETVVAMEPPAAYVVEKLGNLLEQVATQHREEVAQLLGVYTTSGGDPDYRARIVKLLNSGGSASPAKRAGKSGR